MTHKFKIWDKQEQKWFTPTYEAHRGELSELFLSPSGHLLWRKIENGVQSLYDKTTFQDRFEIVWGAGLKDKNGVEINYDCEIFIIDGYDGKYILTKDDFDIPMVSNPDDVLQSISLETVIFSKNKTPQTSFEVIGNIYENKELLKD